MSKVHMSYFEREDVLHVAISDGPEANSIEVSPNITAELDADGPGVLSKDLRDEILAEAEIQYRAA